MEKVGWRKSVGESRLEKRLANVVMPKFLGVIKADFNPCDYRLWAWMKQKLYEKGTALNLDELKTRIREVWDELDVETIRKWLRELRPRLQKVIDDDGKPIQQYFNKV